MVKVVSRRGWQAGVVVEPVVSSQAPPAATGRRALLLSSARELFGLHGYDATSTHAIAKHAGVSQSLVYRHFPSKSELFVEAVFDPFVDMLDSFLQRWDLTDAAGSIDAITRSVTAALCSNVREERELLLAVLAARVLRAGPDEAGRSVRAVLSRVFGRIEEEHIRAAQAHKLRTDPPLTARFFFGLGLVAAVFDDWLFPGQSETQIEHALSAFVAAGASGRPDQSIIDLERSAWIETDEQSAMDTTPPYGRQRPAGSVRPLLLVAARRLFASSGYSATSTKQIASSAEIAESLLFHHFATKSALFEAAITEPLAAALHELTTHISECPTPQRAIVDAYDSLYACRDLLDAAVIAPREIGKDSAIQAQLAGLLSALEHKFTGHDDLNAGQSARLVLSLVLAVTSFHDWLFIGMDTCPARERLLAELVPFALSGTTRR